jgi:23S rRNA (cytidine1920-2'-O)/16S rRNA (cytidine1409-2'-O)-methyltransferase
MVRLDKELVIRNLVETRTQAQETITAKKVQVNGKVVDKCSFNVENKDEISILENDLFKYVSRGGFKLEKALNVFEYEVKDLVVMDIGSSTGGFTDCCLQRGAKKVVAIDVGTNVMHTKLKQDKRVDLHENTNIKDVENELFLGVDLVVTDVSFISLERIVERVNKANVELDMICLIKPQFECGKVIATKYGGIIKSKTIHKDVLNKVINFFNKNNFYIQNLDFSPIKGGDGNIEYLALFTNKKQENFMFDVNKVVNSAFSS